MPCGRCKRNTVVPPRTQAIPRRSVSNAVNPANPTQHLNLLPPSSQFMELNEERRRVESLRRKAIMKALGVG